MMVRQAHRDIKRKIILSLLQDLPLPPVLKTGLTGHFQRHEVNLLKDFLRVNL
jgi:hypothetical protein